MLEVTVKGAWSLLSDLSDSLAHSSAGDMDCQGSWVALEMLREGWSSDRFASISRSGFGMRVRL